MDFDGKEATGALYRYTSDGECTRMFDGFVVTNGPIWSRGGACVTCHDPENGFVLARVKLPATQITNCAFGGPDLKTLFISSARVGLDAAQRASSPLAGGLFCVELDSPGQASTAFS